MLNMENKNNIDESNINKNQNLKDKMDPKIRTHFIKDEYLLLDENLEIEYKNYQFWPLKNDKLVNKLKVAICAFLNNKGGRLYLGINDNKIVEGISLMDKERDVTRNFLTNLATDFYPHCRSDKIDVSFIPVKDQEGENYISNLWVIKVVVRQGETNKLYSIYEGCYKSYMRLSGQSVLLKADEIEKNIIERYLHPMKPVEGKDFEDSEPEMAINSKVRLLQKNNNYYLVLKEPLPMSLPLKERRLENECTSEEEMRVKNQKIHIYKEKNRGSSICATICNVNASTSQTDLYHLLKDYNLDSRRQIQIDDDKALVYFLDINEAEKAFINLDGIVLNGSKITFKINQKI